MNLPALIRVFHLARLRKQGIVGPAGLGIRVDWRPSLALEGRLREKRLAQRHARDQDALLEALALVFVAARARVAGGYDLALGVVLICILQALAGLPREVGTRAVEPGLDVRHARIHVVLRDDVEGIGAAERRGQAVEHEHLIRVLVDAEGPLQLSERAAFGVVLQVLAARALAADENRVFGIVQLRGGVLCELVALGLVLLPEVPVLHDFDFPDLVEAIFQGRTAPPQVLGIPVVPHTRRAQQLLEGIHLSRSDLRPLEERRLRLLQACHQFRARNRPPLSSFAQTYVLRWIIFSFTFVAGQKTISCGNKNTYTMQNTLTDKTVMPT